MRYPSDHLSPEERARLAPHVTDLDAPVFALVNLPETVKGALFARYSRYPGTLRRLFLDEFADTLREGRAYDGDEGRRAPELYERIFVARVERPERGGAWAAYLMRRREAAEHWTARLGLDRDDDPNDGPSVRLLH